MTFTPDVNLGNVLVTAALGALGIGIRKLYKLISDAIDRQEQVIWDVDEHAEVINLHSSLLVEGGLVKGSIGLPRVTERRQRPRFYAEHQHTEEKL